MTRIEFKFKIPYGAIREIHFQTTMRLSFKKKKKKRKKERNAKPYKKKQPFIHGTKETKKKKKSKTQIVFPNQNSYSLRLQILRCSFKHIDRTCVATKTLKPKSRERLWRHGERNKKRERWWRVKTHSLFCFDSPFPLTNSAVLSIFLKIKNPNHWVLFPSTQPPPIYCRENPHWKHQAVGSKASILINPINRKKKSKTSIAHVSIVCNQRTPFNFSTG